MQTFRYSIPEYARDRGISRQSVHKHLSNYPGEHTIIYHGKKYMDYEAYLYLEQVFEGNKIVTLTKERNYLLQENKELRKLEISITKELSNIRKQLEEINQYIKGGGAHEH